MAVDQQGGVPRGSGPPLQECRHDRQIEVGRGLSEGVHPRIVRGDGHLLPPRPSGVVIRAAGITDLPHLRQDRDVRPPFGGPGACEPIPFRGWSVDRHRRRTDREPGVRRSPFHYAVPEMAPHSLGVSSRRGPGAHPVRGRSGTTPARRRRGVLSEAGSISSAEADGQGARVRVASAPLLHPSRSHPGSPGAAGPRSRTGWLASAALPPRPRLRGRR